jgi:FkbM family methyltransferase
MITLKGNVLRPLFKALISSVRLLPNDLQIQIKQNINPVGSLDYPASKIQMCLNSPWQLRRLSSCQKEPETVAWLEKHITPGSVLFDIGANIGAYSLLANRLGGGGVRIYSIEPGFANFADLCQNILLNSAGGTIVPLQFGLGKVNQLASFNYSNLAPGAAFHSWNASTVVALGRSIGFSLSTVVVSLDSIIDLLGLQQPTAIKLDVDGPEVEVLTGAKNCIKAARMRTILVEVSAETETATMKTLQESGLVLRQRHARGSNGFNLIFERD